MVHVRSSEAQRRRAALRFNYGKPETRIATIEISTVKEKYVCITLPMQPHESQYDEPIHCDASVQTEEDVFSQLDLQHYVERACSATAEAMAETMRERFQAKLQELQCKVAVAEALLAKLGIDAASLPYSECPAPSGFPGQQSDGLPGMQSTVAGTSSTHSPAVVNDEKSGGDVKKARKKAKQASIQEGSERNSKGDPQYFLTRYSVGGRLDLDRLKAACRCHMSYQMVLRIIELRLRMLDSATAEEDEDEKCVLFIAKEGVRDAMKKDKEEERLRRKMR